MEIRIKKCNADVVRRFLIGVFILLRVENTLSTSADVAGSTEILASRFDICGYVHFIASLFVGCHITNTTCSSVLGLTLLAKHQQDVFVPQA